MMNKDHSISLRVLLICFLFLMARVPVARAQTTVLEVRTGDEGATLRSSPDFQGDKNRIRGIHADTVLKVLDTVGGWYYVFYDGDYGYVIAAQPYTFVMKAEMTNDPGFQASETYDMGIPLMGGRIVGQDEMNMTVFWVQTQLKAYGSKYWTDGKDITGTLDRKTMEMISAFMRDRGYAGHSGRIDQDVVDELAYALGKQLKAVLVGGYYRALNTLTGTGSTGNMQMISSSAHGARSDNAVRWLQQCLSLLGYYTQSPDGIYREDTVLAVSSFQRDHGFEATGSVSLGVARAMLEAYVAAGGDPDLLLP